MSEAQPRRGRRRRSRRTAPRRDPAPAPASSGSDVRRGVIKWFNRSRSYGFIQGEDGNEVFVHESAVVLGTSDLTLAKGREVEFEVRDTPKGQQAVNVVVVGDGDGTPAAERPAQPEPPAEAPVAEKPKPVVTSLDFTKRLPSSWKQRPVSFVYSYTIYNRHGD